MILRTVVKFLVLNLNLHNLNTYNCTRCLKIPKLVPTSSQIYLCITFSHQVTLPVQTALYKRSQKTSWMI